MTKMGAKSGPKVDKKSKCFCGSLFAGLQERKSEENYRFFQMKKGRNFDKLWACVQEG